MQGHRKENKRTEGYFQEEKKQRKLINHKSCNQLPNANNSFLLYNPLNNIDYYKNPSNY
jgi:hypothetical protein